MPDGPSTTVLPSSEQIAARHPELDDAPLVGRYALEGKIGRGGMGVIADAHDRRIGRRVAIKRLAGQPLPEVVTRFVREARIQGRLDHPAIVPVYDVGIQSDGRPYFAMRKLSGVTLAEVLRCQGEDDAAAIAAWPRARLLEAFVDVCLAIEYTHTRGVLHRDLKPANVMLGDQGGVSVLDWGVACVLPGHEDVGEGLAPGHADAAAGTVGYMAPEQADPAGQTIDARADVYALGCILFEILAALPYIDGDPRPSRRAPSREIPGDLDRVCARALAPDRTARFASARDLADAVLRHLDADQQAELAHAHVTAHVERARAAIARGTGLEARAAAVREAGLALALDPGCKEAAEILQSVLLEPPSEVPPEVAAALAAQDDAILRNRARSSALSYAIVPAFVPVFVVLGVRDWGLVGAALAMTAVLVSVALTAMRGVLPRSRMWIAAFGNIGIILVFSRILGPFVLPPAIAVNVAMQVTTHPTLRRWWLVAIAVSLGPIGAWVLESAGALSPMMRSGDGTLVLDSSLLRLPTTRSTGALVLFVLAVVGTSTVFGRRLANMHDATRRRLAVQAWHLRRLVGGGRE